MRRAFYVTIRQLYSIILWEETVSNKDEESMDIRVSRAVCKAFEQLIHNIENEPGLILEGEDQSEENEHAIREIRSWLFRRRREHGNSDDNFDNQGNNG